ncbi:ABC transporter permease [Pontitalea aquivivens]|uniref:ABC transporter permease n=1 Tax=Pontitalea aquivivens TaxID=3388663 RepID=UPI003970EFA8
MRALDRKTLRDLARLWAQVLAIALVLGCGVMVLVLANGTRASLMDTREAYYERHRFGDVFAAATRAPRSLLSDIAALPGIAALEARITAAALVDLEGFAEPVSARVLSLPASGGSALNLPLLRAGRLPDPLHPDEVALYEPFAQAHGLRPGDRFAAVIKGQRRELVVTGHLLSPEFIYTMGAGSIMPDDRRFGILWMAEAPLAAATDLDGAFNDLTLRLSRGANEAAVIAALDRLLAPYGGTGGYGRARHASHAFLDSEMTQLAALAYILPPIFLIVSAFLVNMVLGRLIALERRQIGLLKAVGYSTGAIGWHYLKLCLGIGVLGVLLGWAAGWWLGQRMTELYTEFFRLPWLIYQPRPGPFAISAALALATVTAGGLRAVRASVRLAPAVAMAPPAPPLFRRGWLDRLGRALRLRQTTMMILRSVARWPGRASVTLFGVSASVAVLVASFCTFDAMDLMMDEMFSQSNRQQVTLILSSARNEAAVQDVLALPGVIRAEGAFALPVRLIHGARSELSTLNARPAQTDLSRLLDSDGRPVALPAQGLVLPEGLARKLDLRPGDMLQVEALAPPRETWAIPLAGTIRQTVGQEAHMDRTALFSLMRSAPQVNMLHLMVDTDRMGALHGAVKATPAVAGLVTWTEVRHQFEQTINENLWISATIYSVLGMLITIGVIYNAARIQLSQRAHDLASLRVLGFRRAEVGYVLVGELMGLTLAAIPPGWLAGYGFAAMIVAGVSTDVVSVPLVIDTSTYAAASLIVLVTALAAALVVRRRLDRIDIVQALKAQE